VTIELIWPEKENAKKEGLTGPSDVFVCSTSGVPSPLQLNSHALIIGDNLEALKIMRHQGEIKFHLIYIDPPYNTGQKFTYRDSMVRPPHRDVSPESLWLSMMYPRLSLAKDLLRDDGVIFISIDDNEVSALSMILFEIFGRENYLATLKWRKKRKPSFLDSHLSTVVEYVLVFSKNRKLCPRLLGEASEESTRPVLNASNSTAERVLRVGTPAFCADGVYAKGVYKNRTLDFELLGEMKVKNGVLVESVALRGKFRVSQEILDRSVFVTKQFGLRRRVLADERMRKHALDDCRDWPTNEDAEFELRTLFGQRVFDFPKPVGMLKKILSMYPTSTEKPLACLDFFAGTGTLAEAVLSLNADDGAERTFVCVQSDEPLKEPLPELGLFHIGQIAEARIEKLQEKYQERFVLQLFQLNKKAD
jgi:adenine-specific DNA-methyltransferase